MKRLASSEDAVNFDGTYILVNIIIQLVAPLFN